MDQASALETILSNDPLRDRLLGIVRSLDLPDCWVGAGFVRNAVWDYMHRRPASRPKGDVDVVWFSLEQADPSEDRRLEARLRTLDASVDWSVKNQARMHLRNGDAPYRSAIDAMRHWPETATAVGVRRVEQGRYGIAAPFGLDDLFGLVLRPTPRFSRADKRQAYMDRLQAKGWLTEWPLLRTAGIGSAGAA